MNAIHAATQTANAAGAAYERVVLQADTDLTDLRDHVHIQQLGQFARDLHRKRKAQKALRAARTNPRPAGGAR